MKTLSTSTASPIPLNERLVAFLQSPTPLHAYQQASLIGFVGGLRSMMPLALLSWNTNEATNSGKIKNLTALLAAGEIIGDKLPFTRSRLSTGPLLGRFALGALAGALLCRRAKASLIQGAIRGAIGAGLGAATGFAYRSLASQLVDVPDIFWAIVEDAVALGLGIRAIAKSQTIATAQ